MTKIKIDEELSKTITNKDTEQFIKLICQSFLKFFKVLMKDENKKLNDGEVASVFVNILTNVNNMFLFYMLEDLKKSKAKELMLYQADILNESIKEHIEEIFKGK